MSLRSPHRALLRNASIYSRARCYASTAASRQEIERARNYCLNLIKKYDQPAFTLQAFVPASSRDAYLALRALNIDVSRIADTTSHPAIGAMRMQFWRDVVSESLAGNPRKEPTAILLASAAEDLQSRSKGHIKWSKTWLFRLINTREQHLGNPPFPDIASVESYAENTYSTLLYLTLQALPMQSLTADHLASHIGKATGIANLLRGLPLIAFPPPPPTHHTSNAKGGAMTGPPQGAVLLPLDIMARTGVQEEQVFRQAASAPGLADAVFEVATRANDHLITAREMLKNIRAGRDAGHEFEHADDAEHSSSGSKEVSQQQIDVDRAFGVLFGPALTTRLWLEKLEKVDFNVFDDSLRKADWKFPIKAYWSFSKREI